MNPKKTQTSPKQVYLPVRQAFHVRTRLIDIQEGDSFTALLNEQEARDHGINSMDKISLIYEGEEIVVDADLSHSYIKRGEVGILKDVVQKYKIEAGKMVAVAFTSNSSLSVEALKKALKGVKLNEKETFSIMKDIATNRFTDTLTTYYSALGFFYPATDHELYIMAKAMAQTGEMLHFPGVVADKHCMWGVPGNETTMIMIPLLTSLGIKMPKTFSKAITTPAATGECVSVLMDISFSKKQIEELVRKHNTCLVWGGGLDLAPADEKLIKAAYPLSMQSYSRTIVSIMAKKYAMGINHSLIDIPMGPTAKVPDMKTANKLKKQFIYVGQKLWMKVHVEITDAIEPIGAGIGAILQVREVLRVLQQHELRPMDLQNKALFLAARIIELVGMAKGKAADELALKTLKSGKAWGKMQEIIKAQHGNPNIKSEQLELAKIKKEIKAEKDGRVKSIDMKVLNVVARTLGAPIDLKAWLYLRKKTGDAVKKWDIIYVLYASEEPKIKMAIEYLDQKKMYEIR